MSEVCLYSLRPYPFLVKNKIYEPSFVFNGLVKWPFKTRVYLILPTLRDLINNDKFETIPLGVKFQIVINSLSRHRTNRWISLEIDEQGRILMSPISTNLFHQQFIYLLSFFFKQKFATEATSPTSMAGWRMAGATSPGLIMFWETVIRYEDEAVGKVNFPRFKFHYVCYKAFVFLFESCSIQLS